jgi:hypothetical protein
MGFPNFTRFFTNKTRGIVKVYNVHVENNADIPSLLYWQGGGKTLLRISMPTRLLVMRGGFSYRTGFHPFVTALREGPEKLRWFYDSFQPKTVAEAYGLARRGRAGEDLPPWELPWYLRSVRAAPPGEKGLSVDHGVSFYGPATDEKVALEYRRLSATRDSIEKYGYEPDRYGDVTGFFLRSGGDYRFFVMGGKHRTAGMVDLGYETIPVVMKPHWPRLIDRDFANEWPLVHDGSMEREVAETIFDRFFNPSGFDLLDADPETSSQA